MSKQVRLLEKRPGSLAWWQPCVPLWVFHPLLPLVLLNHSNLPLYFLTDNANIRPILKWGERNKNRNKSKQKYWTFSHIMLWEQTETKEEISAHGEWPLLAPKNPELHITGSCFVLFLMNTANNFKNYWMRNTVTFCLNTDGNRKQPATEMNSSATAYTLLLCHEKTLKWRWYIKIRHFSTQSFIRIHKSLSTIFGIHALVKFILKKSSGLNVQCSK